MVVTVCNIFRPYAETIETSLTKLGFSVDISIKNDDVEINKILHHFQKKLCFYAIIVSQENLLRNSMTVIVSILWFQFTSVQFFSNE